MSDPERPWLKHYGSVKPNLDYPDLTLYGCLKRTSEQYGDELAYRFMRKSVKYAQLAEDVERFAAALYSKGVRKGDRVLICLPNVPQALHALYGASRIGAVATMIHPLSAMNEIAFYLRDSGSRIAVTLDAFAPNFIRIKDGTPLETLIVTSVKDALGPTEGLLYSITLGRKVPPLPKSEITVGWKEFLKGGEGTELPGPEFPSEDTAVILYSGGTSGTPKGVLLSSANLNATSFQTAEMSGLYQRKEITMLAAMPVFHGFGLCIGIHMFIAMGGTCILVPRFTPESYSKLLLKGRPNFIAGVPTMFEHMLRSKHLENADLSCLRGVFVGGDTSSVDLKRRVDSFLKDHNCDAILREGYGLTECVTASCLTPKEGGRTGSIGIPYPDTYYKIVKPGTSEASDPGADGEICISGPSVMIGYLNCPEEEAEALRIHEDGRKWLHTGDIGTMDREGFVYFKQRLKRIIISSGYNVYPSQVEKVIDSHPDVQASCVIGLPDPIRNQRVKAYIVLKPGKAKTDSVLESIRKHCKESIALYALPRDIEFLDEMPMTRLGKVAYSVLEAMEAQRASAKGPDVQIDPFLMIGTRLQDRPQ